MEIILASRAELERTWNGSQQGACRIKRWGSIPFGLMAFLGLMTPVVLGQPIELASPNEETTGYFGRSISGIPDVDGDGRGDVVVGAFQEDPGASPSNAGRTYIFSGSDGTVLSTLASPNEETGGYFGFSVSGIPDVNGDGRGDVVVGAYYEDPVPSATNAGRAYIFSGSDGTVLSTLASPNGEVDGFFGYSVSGIPDVDGDGRGDIVVGAYYEDPGPVGAGRAYIFSGSDGTVLSTLVSPNQETQGRFGISVSGIPDVDGDGRGDVVVGAYVEDPGASPGGAGRAYIFSGSNGSVLSTLASPNEEANGFFGISVSGIPDVNGDGRGDVIVGARQEDTLPSATDAGRAYVFSGSDGTLLSTLVSPNPEITGLFGFHVSGVADLDGDGRGDVIVGARQEDTLPSATDAGRVYIFSGSDGALLNTLVSPNQESFGYFGVSVSGIPDANGDGRGDVAAGALREDPGASPADAGRAYIFPSTAPEITVTGGPLDFGTQDIDAGPTASQSVTIANDGDDNLNFTGAGIQIAGVDASEFLIVSVTDTSPLIPGATRTVDVAFDPSSTGAKSANLAITTDDDDEPTVNVPLSGTGTDQEITVTGGPLDFGDQDIDNGPTASQSVTIANDGDGNLNFTGAGIQIVGVDASEFLIVSVTDTSPLIPGATRTVDVAFDPSSTGVKSANLAITTDDDDEPTVNVSLSGTGTDQEIDITVPGGSLDFVQTLPGPTAPQTVSIDNIGTATLSFTGAGCVINGTDAADFIISASDISPIPAGATRGVDVVFDPALLDGLPRSANLAITTNDSDEPTVNVPLTGAAYLSVEDWTRY